MACTLDLDRLLLSTDSGDLFAAGDQFAQIGRQWQFFCRYRLVDHGCVDSKFTRAFISMMSKLTVPEKYAYPAQLLYRPLLVELKHTLKTFLKMEFNLVRSVKMTG